MFELITGLAEFEDRQASAVIDDILYHAGPQKGLPGMGTVPQMPDGHYSGGVGGS